jgi:hypothetical protein
MNMNGAEGMQNKWIIKTKKEIRVHSCSFVADPFANEDAEYKFSAPLRLLWLVEDFQLCDSLRGSALEFSNSVVFLNSQHLEVWCAV